MFATSFPRLLPAAAALTQTMDRLVDSVFNDRLALGRSMSTFPGINVWENDQNVFVEAELPGFKIEEVDITFAGNELTIQGKRADAAPEGATFHRRERWTGSFTRTLRLATEIDESKISATLENGVLTVTLPKAEAAKPRRIEVKAK